MELRFLKGTFKARTSKSDLFSIFCLPPLLGLKCRALEQTLFPGGRPYRCALYSEPEGQTRIRPRTVRLGVAPLKFALIGWALRLEIPSSCPPPRIAVVENGWKFCGMYALTGDS
jgi:hypothetical protein